MTEATAGPTPPGPSPRGVPSGGTAGGPRFPARRTSLRDVRVSVRAGARQGWARVHASWFWIVQASVAGTVAYAVAFYGFGHPQPFFAPVSTWIALGFSRDRSVRRVAELAVGVALGVGFGDLVVHLIGSGVWQMGLVLAASALVGRFVDRAALITTQAGVQAIVIVCLPAASGGPFGRWLDAVVGGLVGLAAVLLTPSDPRRHVQRLARAATEELAGMLHTVARGLRTGTVADVEDALVRGRASQPALDEWRESAVAARDLARMSPATRRHREELAGSVGAAVLLDRAVRNTRVLTRRAVTVVEDGQRAEHIAELLDAAGFAVEALAEALGAGRDPARARAALLAVAAGLDPFRLASDDWQAQSLVLLARSLVVDLLEAAGTDPGTARGALPEL